MNPNHDPENGQFTTGGGTADVHTKNAKHHLGSVSKKSAADHTKDAVSIIDERALYSRPYDPGNERTFFLSFGYKNPNGSESTGTQSLRAPDMETAVARIARERSVKELTVKKRFQTGRPASDAEEINKVFRIK